MSYRLQDQDERLSPRTVNARPRWSRPSARQPRGDGLDAPEEEQDDGPGLIPRRVTKSEIIYVTSQLAIMVETGMTLSAALEGIVREERNSSLKRVLSELKDAVESGEDFSTALARHPQAFRQDLRRPGEGQRGDRHAGRDARSHLALPAQGTGDSRQSAGGHGLSQRDARAGHRRDDLPADVRAAEVHAAVHAQRHSVAQADHRHDGHLRRAA